MEQFRLAFLAQEMQVDGIKDDPAVKSETADVSHVFADETWVVSPAEKTLLQRDRPEKSIQVVSNIVDVPGSALPFEQRKDLLFIGSFQHPPNIDAVLFFAGQAFPLIRRQLPEVKFYIVGDKAPPEIIALADENIIVTGFQPDVSSYFNTVRLSVAPLRYGAGVKGKINQSMGYGVPVVATSIAAEGMSLRAEKDAMIADDARSFAASVVTLYRSEELWRRLSQNGISKTKELYSVEAAREQIEKILGVPQASDLSISPAFTHALQEPVEA